MKKIVLTAAALLIAAGSAYAANDNVGGTDINKQATTANVDTSHTGSIRNEGSPVYKLLNSSGDAQKSAPQGSDRNLFGR
ncbi:DUF680 domain-containing protein [Mesorhizobium sp. B2-4-12]|uniref:DUF680 domain-containing protein n=1 Tax=unclassified Mesorhizobium TaxID=325217 RepID=UPI001128C44F|nr:MULTISPECIES: DUF680 domain-containing protein [unclassified Mesorhizobium]TPK74915.1 DUF680 domain-containing protein [Mesorhizobium sp. B2-4-17]TPK99674.1 DUF680 domain-containing protein [Mesorhizobium sp. B2-4-12]TPL11608.1 DUF680 domain-containing protein [Mesorhizobium sp. B2-4-14]UCI31238.1 DUF680 domain-containing protein [Mesorhizobium sp. B4-1-4]